MNFATLQKIQSTESSPKSASAKNIIHMT